MGFNIGRSLGAIATGGLSEVARAASGSLGGPSLSQGGLPAWVSQAGQENYDFAKQISSRPMYQGQRVAGFSPTQQAALTQIGGLTGQGQQLAQQGFNLLGNIGSAADRISAYQNPYTQEVLDRSMGDLERQRQIALQQSAGQSLANNAFGGSRQAVREALTNENYAKQMADTAANLRYQGFNTALGAAQQDVQQQQQLAQALQGAGYGALQSGLQAGALEQQQNQAQLDAAKAAYDYPLEQLAIRQSALGQTPYNNAPYVQQPDRFSQLLQLGGTVAGIGAMFSDKKMKENIKPVKGTNILNKLEAMPVKEWSYKEQYGIGTEPHIGTMAQDFAKHIGGDGKTIDIPTAIGVNLIGIQQLAKKVRKLESKA